MTNLDQSGDVQRIEDLSAKPVKCTNCGVADFEWGWVHHWGYGTFLLYKPLAKYNLFGEPGIRVESKRCLSCNQLSFFCDPAPRLVRFSLRALLIATTLAAFALGLIAYAIKNN